MPWIEDMEVMQDRAGLRPPTGLTWQGIVAVEPRLEEIERTAYDIAPLMYDVCHLVDHLVRQYVGPTRGFRQMKACDLPEHTLGSGVAHMVRMSEMDKCNKVTEVVPMPDPQWLGHWSVLELVMSHMCGLKAGSHDDCCEPGQAPPPATKVKVRL